MKWFTIMDKDGPVDTIDLDFITVVEIISCITFTHKLRNYGMNKLSNRCIENRLGDRLSGWRWWLTNVPEGTKQVEYSRG